MNYQKIYDNLIARASNRILEGYTEKHHIVPRCMGGSDDPSNLVRLTPEEHFLCHQLLVKIHPHEVKLVYAAKMMTIGANDTVLRDRSKLKLYGWLRRRFSLAMKSRIFTDEHRANISKNRKGIPVSTETRSKISKIKSGKPNPKGAEAQRGVPKPALSAKMVGKPGNRKGKKGTPEFCAMRSETMKGKPGFFTGKTHSEETKEKLRAAFSGQKQERVICPHCMKEGGSHAMHRYHFDKCKTLKYNTQT